MKNYYLPLLLIFTLFACQQNDELEKNTISEKIDLRDGGDSSDPGCCYESVLESTLVNQTDECCFYEVTAFNGENCNLVLNGKGFSEIIPPYQQYTKLITVCGTQSVVTITLSTTFGQICQEVDLDCSSECCNDSNLQLFLLPYSEECCHYEAQVTNDGDCPLVLQTKGWSETVYPSPYVQTFYYDVCSASGQISLLNGTEICHVIKPECTYEYCCSDVTYEVDEKEWDGDCCNRWFTITNHGPCDVLMQDKFGNLTKTLAVGQTTVSETQACNGIDNWYPIYTIQPDGVLKECDSIFLDADCI